MAGVFYEDLERVRGEADIIVPQYNVLKDDPLEAIETGVGNCFAKAIVAAGILSVRHYAELGDNLPAGVFSRRLHATEKPSSFGMPPKPNRAHYTLLVPDAAKVADDEWAIFSLDFGIDGREDEGDIGYYNEVGDAVEYVPHTDSIKATRMHREDDMMYVDDWKTNANTYAQMIVDGPRNADDPIPELPFPDGPRSIINFDRLTSSLVARPELELQ